MYPLVVSSRFSRLFRRLSPLIMTFCFNCKTRESIFRSDSPGRFSRVKTGIAFDFLSVGVFSDSLSLVKYSPRSLPDLSSSTIKDRIELRNLAH